MRWNGRVVHVDRPGFYSWSTIAAAVFQFTNCHRLSGSVFGANEHPAEGGGIHVVHALHCSLNLKESYMSLINGDKARDHKRHKKLIKKRQKLQELKAKRAAGPQKSKPLMGR